jgi:hypothetical protein
VALKNPDRSYSSSDFANDITNVDASAIYLKGGWAGGHSGFLASQNAASDREGGRTGPRVNLKRPGLGEKSAAWRGFCLVEEGVWSKAQTSGGRRPGCRLRGLLLSEVEEKPFISPTGNWLVSTKSPNARTDLLAAR